MELNDAYWEGRYQENKTGWDLGSASEPIVSYLKTLINKELKILIPGCGNAYEAEWALNNGFRNVHILDFAASAIENFKLRFPSFQIDHIHHEDFFEHQGSYDLIIEQTFFCAINPEWRQNYAKKMHSLLHDKGVLVGLLFDTSFVDGPPFGGSKQEYLSYFSSYFDLLHFETCYNSITPRAGKELFIELRKK